MKRIHTNSIFTQCHLSSQTHIQTSRKTSDFVYKSTSYREATIVAWQRFISTSPYPADIPAFQHKIQPKTALVSHRRIWNRTLNNRYYSDTGFHPLSLRSFSPSLRISFLFSCVYEKESKILRENTSLYVCVPHENVFFCQPQFDSGTLLLTEEDTQQNLSTVYLTHT